MTDKKLEGRLALITGASRGIGRAVALEMAKEGADIIAISRTRSQAALEKLDDEIRALGQNCTLVPMDLKDEDAIDRLGAAIYERWGKLDILVGNAGVLGPISPLTHIDPKAWTELMQLNVTANWRLIRSMDPLLRIADAGRALFVTSGAATNNKAYWGGYAASKAALESLVRTYAAECNITNVRANLINPGPIATNMRAAAVPGENPETLPKPGDIAPLFVEMAMSSYSENGQTISFYEWANIKRA